MPERPWLGIQLAWHDVVTSSGEGQAAIVSYRRRRLPWLKSRSHIVAVFYPVEKVLRFYDVPAIAELRANMKAFWTIDHEKIGINALEELAGWPDTEALYHRFTQLDLAVEYRATFAVNDLIRRWRPYGIKGWWIIDRRGDGIALVREFIDIRDGASHAVALSHHGMSLYRYDMLRGSGLADADRILLLKIKQLEMDRLARVFSRDDALAIRSAARHYRLMIFEMAREYELPF
ncbi:hypothetical protein [Oryzomonas rubra]|uniref:Uncharacterized protein n=1 Tax=Oryzomonas rubra TaxID=2509454 RepID=A0A5A9XSC9_9BACT|nr:hypothetical protein [Oryzomonas rubra]KAA0895455.1 hypothetical protein ET418_02745 [Oryzomonas rubra]